MLVGLNISPARLHAGSFSSPVFLEVQEQGQGCRDPRRGRATRGGRSSQPAGRRGHPRAVTRLCPPSQKWHKSGGFGNHNNSPRPGRISPFSRGWAVVIRGPKKPPDGGGTAAPGKPTPPRGKVRQKQSNINFRGWARPRATSGPGRALSWHKGRQGQILAPQHRSPLPNPCECHGSAPSLPVHVCTRSCKRQGCVWARGGAFPTPTRDFFFFLICMGLSPRCQPQPGLGACGRAGGQAPVTAFVLCPTPPWPGTGPPPPSSPDHHVPMALSRGGHGTAPNAK